MFDPSPKYRREIGNVWERMAREYLERQGFRIVAANWTARAAEIDAVARDTAWTLWFFEIRFRQSSSAGTAAESFTRKKRRDFFRAVAFYCLKHGVDGDGVRTGLVAIDRTPTGHRIVRYADLEAP